MGKGDDEMRRCIVAMTAMALLLGATAGQAQWKMRVHEGQVITEFWVSWIDSVTFYADTGPEKILVPAGSFTMGDGVAFCGEDEREVTVTRDFYLGKYEITNQEYLDAVQWAYYKGYVTATATSVVDNLDGSTEELLDLDDDACEIQFNEGNGRFSLRESPTTYAQAAYPSGYDPAVHPVKQVTWYGAARYCDWLSLQSGFPRAYEHAGNWSCNGGDPYGAVGYRLPTDAEWEYAAQYDDERPYPWGSDAPDCDHANIVAGAPYCVGWTAPIGSCPAGISARGFLDLGGNEWEWCNDWWECSLGTEPATDPVGAATGTERVVRGGAWIGSSGTTDVLCSARNRSRPFYFDLNYYGGGFRIARTFTP
jgi:formylglycine-generating enzyme required for sulfatase activity